MKKLLVLSFLSISLSVSGQRAIFTATSVHDGDSYYGTIGGIFTRIRLVNVDCPETANKHSTKGDQEFGLAAKDSVANYIKKGEKYLVIIHGQDKYKRTLAEVYVRKNGRNKALSNLVLESGWGWVNTDYIKNPKLTLLLNKQKIAKNKKLGLWSYDNPIEPSVFRAN